MDRVLLLMLGSRRVGAHTFLASILLFIAAE
jgi:hypothetical protein